MEQQNGSFYVSLARQLLEEGFITIDEYGYATLTEKGNKRVAKRLDNLPAGDEILLDLAFCEGHSVPVSLFKRSGNR